MDFGFTDEQHDLRASVRDFVAKEIPPRQAKEWDESFTTPDVLFRAFSELDWLAIPFPEELGGIGGGAIETAIVTEELGRASFDVAMCFVTSLIVGMTVFRWAGEDTRRRVIEDLLAGRQRYAVSISEAGAGSDVSALSARAETRGEELVLNGTKMWCTGAGVPGTTLAIYVRTDPASKGREGISLVLVDPDSPGVELRQIPTLARHILGTYEVILDDVVVPASNLVGRLNQGWDILLSGLQLERVLICAGYVGAAQSTLDEALSYSKEREQFGKRIGDFQALGHELADVQTAVDAAWLLAYRAAWRLDAGLDCAREGAMAKLFASETYVSAARTGMQVMAGYGFSTESVMSYRWREAIVAPISGGTSQIQRSAIAGTMGLRTR